MGDGPAVLKGFVEGLYTWFCACTDHARKPCVHSLGSNSAHGESKLSTRGVQTQHAVPPPAVHCPPNPQCHLPRPLASPSRRPRRLRPCLSLVAGRPRPTPASPARLTITPPTPPSPVALAPRLPRPPASPSCHPRHPRPSPSPSPVPAPPSPSPSSPARLPPPPPHSPPPLPSAGHPRPTPASPARLTI